VRRASNTISDALAGVTLNLQQAEAGSSSTIVIGRDVDGITKTVSNLALAYNELLKFKDGQAKADQPLHNDPSLRSGFGTITSTLLAPVVGITGVYTTGGLVGLALQRDGTLSLDSDVFKAALSKSFADVQSLFGTGGTATNGNVSYWTSTDKSVPGTYNIDITALATSPGISSAGFSGTYSDDGTPDTMTVTDSISGYSGSVALANGDTIDTIVDKLNAMFASSRQAITATKNGNELMLSGSNFGTAAKITVAYTGGGTDSTAQLGLAAGAYSGTDVAGSIGGLPAPGNGQLLTGASGGATDGLSVRYTGAVTGAMGSISFVLGLSGGLYRSADELAKLGGSITTQTDALTLRINQLQTRADTVQQALDRRRDSLTRQFVAMEAALSRIQQQGTTLTNFINSLNAQKSS
jgi:flagellar hook-associated protein 2